MLKIFSSAAGLASYADAYFKDSASYRPYRTAISAGFFGTDTWGQLIGKAHNGGEETHVERARAMADKFSNEFESVMPQWSPAVAGAYPCVPEAIMGAPEPMRHKTTVVSDMAPLRIWVAINSSGSIPAEVITARGTGILALCMALVGTGRPIELFGYVAQDGNDGETIAAFQLQTAPLSLAEACFTLCNPGWARRIIYATTSRLNGATGSFPEGYDMPLGEAYAAKIAAIVGAHVVIRRPDLDEETVLLKNPQKWVAARAEEIKAAIANL